MLNAVFNRDDKDLTVKPVGDLDSMTSPDFEKEFRNYLPGVQNVTVDFEDLDYISSAGLRVFLSIQQTLEESDARMKIIHVKEHIMEILDLVGFTSVIDVE